MSTGYRVNDQFATYFLTPTVVDWVDVFTRSEYRDIIVKSLDFCTREKSLVVYGYVVMTNHLHLLVRSKDGSLSDTIRDFKKFTARRIIELIKNGNENRREWMLHRFEWNAGLSVRSNEHKFWTHENRAEVVHSEDFFLQKLNYVHDNPVRSGWVARPEDFVYSSAKALMYREKGPVFLGDG